VPTITTSVDVDVPVSAAYASWARFESFPLFVAAVKNVTWLDETHLRWDAVIGGTTVHWVAEITEQVPERLISWRSTSGAANRGSVRFIGLSEKSTHVELTVDYEARSAIVRMAAAVGMDRRLAETLLRGFKRFVESSGTRGASA
jgi:uncharacterized membrane protein